VSYYSQQTSFRYSKRHSNDNSTSRHQNKINTFSEFHGGYFSDGRLVGFRNRILSYSEDYFLKEISLKTTPLLLTTYQGCVVKSPNSLSLYSSVALERIIIFLLAYVQLNAA